MFFLCSFNIHKWGKWDYYDGDVYYVILDKTEKAPLRERFCERCGQRECQRVNDRILNED